MALSSQTWVPLLVAADRVQVPLVSLEGAEASNDFV